MNFTDIEKNRLLNFFMIPIMYMKKFLDTEKLMNEEYSNITITNNNLNSFINLKEYVKYKIINSEYKRKLLNFDSDTIKDFIISIINANNFNNNDINVNFNIKYESYTLIIRLIINYDYLRFDIQKDNLCISLSTENTINNELYIGIKFITYDNKYLDEMRKKPILLINFMYDLDKDKFSEPYIIASKIDNILVKDIENLEGIIVDIYEYNNNYESILKLSLKRLSIFMQMIFSKKEDIFQHSIVTKNMTDEFNSIVNTLIKKCTEATKYNSIDKQLYKPIAECDNILIFCQINIDNNTIINGSYEVIIKCIKKESVLTFNSFIANLKNRKQIDITWDNTYYAFDEFVTYTKAINRGNYMEYKGRSYLEINEKEIEKWNNKISSLIIDDKSKIMQQELVERVNDPFAFYSIE